MTLWGVWMWSMCWCCGVWVDVEHVLVLVLVLWVGPPAVRLLKAPGSPCAVELRGCGCELSALLPLLVSAGSLRLCD